MFIYFWDTQRERERERERAWTGEGQREGDTESEAGSTPWAVSTEPDSGLKPTNCEIMTWPKGGRLNDWVTQVTLSTFSNTVILHYTHEMTFLEDRGNNLFTLVFSTQHLADPQNMFTWINEINHLLLRKGMGMESTRKMGSFLHGVLYCLMWIWSSGIPSPLSAMVIFFF